MNKVIKLKELENELNEMDLNEALIRLQALMNIDNKKFEKLFHKYSKKLMAKEKELKRYKEMTHFENEAYLQGCKYIAGIDEAGRGPLAGPVVAGAVVLPKGVIIEGLNDSKKVSALKREQLFDEIIEKAIACSVGVVDEKVIDEINILNATKVAMSNALDGLNLNPDMVLIDAVKLNRQDINQKAIIKGDELSISIAAASIIAKVTRDRMMLEFDNIYPQYGFAKHKGYGTEEHRDAIKKHGLCPIHRIGFSLRFT